MVQGRLLRRPFYRLSPRAAPISIVPRIHSCFHSSSRCKMLHHLMVGTWTPPGAIFTFQFDDEALTLKMIKRTAIPEDEPISWMTFDVSLRFWLSLSKTNAWHHFPSLACKETNIWSCHEEMVQFHRQESNWNYPQCFTSNGTWS